MKKQTLVLFFLFSFGFLYSQKCKNLVVDKKDEFTGEVLKTSISLLQKGKGHETHFEIRQKNDKYSITFIDFYYGLAMVSGYFYNGKKDDLMYVLLSDGTVIKLRQQGACTSRSEEPSMGESMIPGFGRYAALGKSQRIIFDPVFEISNNDLNILSNKTITKIRVMASGTQVKTKKLIDNIEIVVDEKNSLQFLEDVKCLFNKAK